MRLVNSTRVHLYMYGHSLIELMLSVTLTGIIFTGISYVCAAHEKQNNSAEQFYLVQQDAKNLLAMMQQELARAGYQHGAETVNPFVYNQDNIYILNTYKDCILYRYDRNDDGMFSHESFGFRLYRGGLQRRKGSEVSCDGGLGWEIVSDAAYSEVNRLQFIVSQQRDSQPDRVKAYVKIELSIRHRQLTDIEFNFVRNSSARVLL